MLLIYLTNIKNLNTSMQVGDAIYVTSIASTLLDGSNHHGLNINASNMAGILRKIDNTSGNNYTLHVDDANNPNVVVNTGDFIMFSKYDQSDGDIKGYYMEVQFVNNSREKVELFSVGSEVTESSK